MDANTTCDCVLHARAAPVCPVPSGVEGKPCAERRRDRRAAHLAAGFKKLLRAKNVVVDTRNADEFARGHMPGAVLLPLEGQLTWPPEFEKTVAMLQATKKPVVAYCA